MIPLFHNYQIRKLSETEIKKFINKQLNEKEIIDKIIKSISDNPNSYINSFLQNPLLLSLYILTFQSYSDIPNKKYIFYRRVIDVLFSEHDSLSKLGYVRERKCNLSQEQFEEVLKRFSIITYFEDTYNFDKEYLYKKLNGINNFIQNIHLNIDDFINDLKSGISLWIEDNGIISFAHRSIQEYFAALYIRNVNDKNKDEIYSKILNKINNIKLYVELTNFLSLCEEMDEYFFTKDILIPILELTLSQIDESNEYTIAVTMIKNSYTGFNISKIAKRNMFSLVGVTNNWKYSFATSFFKRIILQKIFYILNEIKPEEIIAKIKSIKETKAKTGNSTEKYYDIDLFFANDLFKEYRNDLINVANESYIMLKNKIKEKKEYLVNYDKSIIELINSI